MNGKLIAIMLLTCIQFHAISQSNCHVDLQLLQGKKIKSFFKEKALFDSNSFLHLESSCFTEEDHRFSEHEKTYVIDQNLDFVWKAYTTGNIKEIWSGKILQFGGAYSESQDSFVYNDLSASYGIEEGQIIITKLKYLKGILKIVVAHKITKLDNDSKQIQFCYMKGGKTEGSQLLSFTEGPDDTTIISHVTFYKSHSKFRDKRLYPKLHTKAIDELHANIGTIMTQDESYRTLN